MKRSIFTTTLMTLGLVLGAASEAQAWHWSVPFTEGPWHGAAGNYYTGSPRSLGITCGTCHVGAQNIPPNQRVQMQVTVRRVNNGNLVADDIFANGYMPGARYKISVAMSGEHKGRQPDDGSYEDPNGSAFKVSCPHTVDNVNILTAEVMNEADVYADFDGNGAGTLRADANNDPNSTTQANACREGACPNNNPYYPNRTLQGGPTTVSLRSWRLGNPNSNPPFGGFTCSACDSIVANFGGDTTPGTGQPFAARSFHFFWTAPATPPATGNGRIRFYMSMVDGDGYTDVYDDDVAEFRRAVCPQGNAACNPTNPPWNYTAAPPVALPPAVDVRPAPPSGDVLWVLAMAGLTVLVIMAFQVRARRTAMAVATLGLLAATAAMASGCVNVKAWERGRMASLVMSRGPDVEEAMIERTFLESREGSSGGSAAGAGGGCACN
ncbi:MAG: DUF4266 domain-containing protein [Myxococcales bacterium]|nr:DUF4266 domain-containing protein [Myxococcales bacterium]MCB9647272.1 DUF4266 domain-containing protein [Deltaproteobacteria bacterium]